MWYKPSVSSNFHYIRHIRSVIRDSRTVEPDRAAVCMQIGREPGSSLSADHSFYHHFPFHFLCFRNKSPSRPDSVDSLLSKKQKYPRQRNYDKETYSGGYAGRRTRTISFRQRHDEVAVQARMPIPGRHHYSLFTLVSSSVFSGLSLIYFRFCRMQIKTGIDTLFFSP